MPEYFFNDLIEMLKKVKSEKDDLPKNQFNEMINATIAGTMRGLLKEGMEPSKALFTIKEAINKHIDVILKEFNQY